MKNILLVFLFLSSSAFAADARLNKLFSAIAKVESGNNPKALNAKENAIGIYQIRPAYFLDSRIKGKHSDAYNVNVAREVCEAYFKRYAPEAYKNADFETLARLHNSGPAYSKRKHLTNGYWQKVKKNLDN